MSWLFDKLVDWLRSDCVWHVNAAVII